MKTKPKTKSKPAISAVKPTRVVFLLDRTGSMSTVNAETISGFNGYLDTLKGAPNTTITVVQFDTLGIDKLCDAGREASNNNRNAIPAFSPAPG